MNRRMTGWLEGRLELLRWGTKRKFEREVRIMRTGGVTDRDRKI